MLSYAFVINGWMDKIKDYSNNGNTTGLVYYYSMIIKSIFFYDVPEMGSLMEAYPELNPDLITSIRAVVDDLSMKFGRMITKFEKSIKWDTAHYNYELIDGFEETVVTSQPIASKNQSRY
jgi:hypothetical protein